MNLTIGWEMDQRGCDDFFVIDAETTEKLTGPMTLANATADLRKRGGEPPPVGEERTIFGEYTPRLPR